MINAHNIYQQWRMVQQHRQKLDAKDFDTLLTTHGYWTEVGGLFILCPRRYGKTTALRGFIERLKSKHPDDKVVTVCPYKATMKHLNAGDIRLYQQEGTSWLHGIDARTSHLVVDEFAFLRQDLRSYLLGSKWRSVTMIGSMAL